MYFVDYIGVHHPSPALRRQPIMHDRYSSHPPIGEQDSDLEKCMYLDSTNLLVRGRPRTRGPAGIVCSYRERW